MKLLTKKVFLFILVIVIICVGVIIIYGFITTPEINFINIEQNNDLPQNDEDIIIDDNMNSKLYNMQSIYIGEHMNINDITIDKWLYEDDSHEESHIRIYYPSFSTSDNHDMIELNNFYRAAVLSMATELYGKNYINLELEVDFTVNMFNGIVSVIFNGIGNIKTAAYPNHIFLTFNSTISENKKIKLSDVLVFNKSLVKMLRQRIQENYQDDIEEIFEFLYGSDDDIIDLLMLCDSNETACCSYYMEDRIGISFPMNHVAGDQILIEFKVEDIRDYLLNDNLVY